MGETNTGFELKEPASPETLVPSIGLWPWWLGAALVLLIIAAVLIVRKNGKPAADPAAARNAAFAEAVAALSHISTDMARDAALRSSLILRRYLSTAAGDPALFETHEEFVSRHDSLQALNAETREAAESGFARLAELKYAPEIPDAAAADVLSDSRALLETLHRGFAA